MINFSNAFASLLPPPNITGPLHIGHAFNQIVTDIVIRCQHIRGNESLFWSAGFDHAGIATQLVMESFLSRVFPSPQINKRCLVESIWEWYYLTRQKIVEQSEYFGCSLNWWHHYFTLGRLPAGVVREIFAKLDADGLIYKAHRIVNWDPKLDSVLSDLEVSFKTRTDNLWYVKYQLVSADKSLLVCTVRPETMFSDVALLVNPADDRYVGVIGAKVIVPIIERTIPLVANERATKDFGSGVVKLTPEFSKVDLSTSLALGLSPIVTVSSTKRLNAGLPPKYKGQVFKELKGLLLLELKFRGLLAYSSKYTTNVPVGSKTEAVVEPILSKQWFLNLVRPTSNNNLFPFLSLAASVLEVLRTKRVVFFPAHWLWLCWDWLESIGDWCLSRQIQWGHKIPSQLFRSEGSTMDTWFSSAAVPLISSVLSSLRSNFKELIPATVLFTGYDILFFWVVRMIMIGVYCAGEVPFSLVYVHGLFCDEQGTKMSKSKGNSKDPIDLLDQLQRAEHQQSSTDIFRTTLVSMATMGRRMVFDCSKFRGYSSFLLKVLNVNTFIELRLRGLTFRTFRLSDPEIFCTGSTLNKWMISEVQNLSVEVNKNLTRCRVDKLTAAVVGFIRQKYCEQYIGFIRLTEKFASKARRLANILSMVLTFNCFLKLLYPVAPVVATTLLNKSLNHFNNLSFSGVPSHTARKPRRVNSLTNTFSKTIVESIGRLVEVQKETANCSRSFIMLVLMGSKGMSPTLIKDFSFCAEVITFDCQWKKDFDYFCQLLIAFVVPVKGVVLFSRPEQKTTILSPVVCSTKYSLRFSNFSYVCFSRLATILDDIKKHSAALDLWYSSVTSA